MHKFLAKTILFAIIVVALIFALEIGLYAVPNEYSLKHKRLRHHGDEIKTLIIGHSQAYFGLDPEVMGDSVFNSALPSQAPYYDMNILEEYMAQMPNLKNIIWPIKSNIHYFDAHPDPLSQKSFKNLQLCMMDKYWGYAPDGGNRLIFWPELLWTYWRGPMLMRFYYSDLPCTELGWSPLPINGTPTDKVPVTALSGDKEQVMHIVEENIGYARQIALLCRDHGVHLIVIKFPCLDEDIIDDEDFNVDELKLCLDCMKAAYPELTYCDLSDDVRFAESDFYDYSHVNSEGAKKLSKIIKEEILAE